MIFLPIVLCMMSFFLFLAIYFGISQVIQLNIYILHVCLGFAVILYHVMTQTVPYDLIILLLVQVVLLHVKHRSLNDQAVGLRFYGRLYRIVGWAILFTVATRYISMMPIGLNVIFAWLSAIGLSALYALSCFVAMVSAYNDKSESVRPADIFLILGAGIYTEQVTPMLAARLDKTLALWRRQPQTQILVSGGQGPDEPIPEALAMQRYLIAKGVPHERIYLESTSTSTYENIALSQEVLADLGLLQRHIVCITSHFHILRALRFGQKLNVNMEGIGSASPLSFLHIMLVRDFLAIMYQYRLLLTIYFAVLFFSSIIAMWFIPH
ncbi:YdcF family protein [Staphylococcus argensis]|uniref:YdcF family protein n=1 Tax=Staphylococcus argensis TaxID=1607738 RepID=UPI002284DA17|nr:YdcF family protein [Staphylococcus argensis]MCY6992031.1 YdcF family protein [Staphylococcus argensis]